MSIKQAFDKWQRANEKLNEAESTVNTLRFDYRTAETEFENHVAIHGPFVDGDDIYYIDKEYGLQATKVSKRPDLVPKDK